MRSTHQQPARRTFTLIGLLVVVSIIAVLASMLLPALSQARTQAKLSVELSNMRQLGIAVASYSDDFQGLLPGANDSYAYNNATVRNRLSPDYTLLNAKTWGCEVAMGRPGWTSDFSKYWYWNVGNQGALSITGAGISNETRGAGVPPNGSWSNGYVARLDGVGFKLAGKYPSPETIALVTDAGGMAWKGWSNNVAGPWSNHPPAGNALGKPRFSQTLTLAGNTLRRSSDALGTMWDGGQSVWR